MNYKKLFLYSILSLSFLLYAEGKLENLLNGFYKNNLDLLELSNEVENQILQTQADKISNGFSIKLETGQVNVNFGTATNISLSPSLTFALPQADNLSLKLSSDIDFDDKASFTNNSISLQSDIYSSFLDNRKITLEKSSRKLLELQRKLQDGFVSAESEFYTQLKSIYELGAQVVTAEKQLYEDKIDFEKKKAQGYGSSSSTYRMAQMELYSSEHNYEVIQHKLESQLKVFAAKCGQEYTTNVWDFLPAQIAEVKPVSVLDYEKENFKSYESASYTTYINEKIRKADKTVNVTGSIGYTFNSSDLLNSQSSSSDTVDLGTSLSLKKSFLKANAGVSIPVDGSSPVARFGLSLDPNAFRLEKITEKQKKLEEKNEQLAIEQALSDYETTVISQESKLEDLKFNKSKIEETLSLYTELEKEMKNSFERGYISESEYKSYVVNKEKYTIEKIINQIDFIIYNNSTKLYFVRDSERKND